jgi:hypothetical protein
VQVQRRLKPARALVAAEWFDTRSIRLAKAAGFGANCASLPARRGAIRAIFQRETPEIGTTSAESAEKKKRNGTPRGDKTGHAACDTIEDVTQRFFARIFASVRRLRTAWTSRF